MIVTDIYSLIMVIVLSPIVFAVQAISFLLEVVIRAKNWNIPKVRLVNSAVAFISSMFAVYLFYLLNTTPLLTFQISAISCAIAIVFSSLIVLLMLIKQFSRVQIVSFVIFSYISAMSIAEFTLSIPDVIKYNILP